MHHDKPARYEVVTGGRREDNAGFYDDLAEAWEAARRVKAERGLHDVDVFDHAARKFVDPKET